ncbi:hypothetical protein DQ04_24531000, partial [Trypanosoma grayi]|uniref:hypothetical protein n=1 Tax=Trypanosoma grayi TaxID=71804 RepID=UPI0004F44250
GNLLITLHICIDNTTVMHIMQKGNTHSDALVGEAGHIDRVLRDHGLNATWGYVASENNPADGMSRGAKVFPTDIAKGWDLRRGGRGRRVKGAFSTSFSPVGLRALNSL